MRYGMILIIHCSVMKMGMSEEMRNKRNTLRSQRLRSLKFKKSHPFYILYCFNHMTCWKLQNFRVTKNDQWLSGFLGLKNGMLIREDFQGTVYISVPQVIWCLNPELYAIARICRDIQQRGNLMCNTTPAHQIILS